MPRFAVVLTSLPSCPHHLPPYPSPPTLRHSCHTCCHHGKTINGHLDPSPPTSKPSYLNCYSVWFDNTSRRTKEEKGQGMHCRTEKGIQKNDKKIRKAKGGKSYTYTSGVTVTGPTQHWTSFTIRLGNLRE